MEILAYISTLFALGGIFSSLLLYSNPYVAYHVALQKAEQVEILKHKWLESEKAGHDIGIELAQQSWEKYHAKDWRASKRKAA